MIDNANEKLLREAGEDYLEAILRLEEGADHVRSIDVAAAMNVSRPSVNKAIGVLKKAGMVEQKPYGHIYLTDLGREQAAEILGRHRVFKYFLTHVLHVDPEVAENEACKMEHVVSEETMKKFVAYIENLENKQ